MSFFHPRSSQFFSINSYANLRLAGFNFLESVIFFSARISKSCYGIPIAATTNGPIIGPLPASSTPMWIILKPSNQILNLLYSYHLINLQQVGQVLLLIVFYLTYLWCQMLFLEYLSLEVELLEFVYLLLFQKTFV